MGELESNRELRAMLALAVLQMIHAATSIIKELEETRETE